MNSNITKLTRFVKVTAIASVLSLCTLQGVRADYPSPPGSGSFPKDCPIIYQNSQYTYFANGMILVNATGVYYFPDGTVVYPDGTVVSPG